MTIYDRRHDRPSIRTWRVVVLALLSCMFVIVGYDFLVRSTKTLTEIKKLREETAAIKASHEALQRDLADLAKIDRRLAQLEAEVERIKIQATQKFGQ
jgi:Tfp pilus assembly protein PilO